MSRPASEQLSVVAEASGQAEADLMRSLLEAHGITVWLSGESAGGAIGLSLGRLGRIEVLVRESDLEPARQLLDRGPD